MLTDRSPIASGWQILSDVREAVSEGATPLVLTNRTDHLNKLAMGFSDVEHVLVLKGGMGKKELKAVAGKLASIPEGTPRVILATGNYIGEGFDDSRLDALFLTMPIFVARNAPAIRWPVAPNSPW